MEAGAGGGAPYYPGRDAPPRPPLTPPPDTFAPPAAGRQPVARDHTPARRSSAPATRFDPLAEPTGTPARQAAAAFDVCHPALALRAVLLVQAALAVALAARRAGTGGAPGGRAGLCRRWPATLLWLVLVCALRPLRRPRGPARVPVLGLGAAGGAAGLGAAVAWAGLAGDRRLALRRRARWPAPALAALLWAWLDLRSRIWQPATPARGWPSCSRASGRTSCSMR
jgi:two-component system sensor histidine kinase AlgZ